ncbi:MAG: helix-turn-helix domain-containing protein [Terrimicrobiaceae bacterium]
MKKIDQPKEPAASRPVPATSILEELFGLLEEAVPLRVNFEDLSGILGDVGEMALSGRWRVHTCAFCQFAKSRSATHGDCITNKQVCNRLATRRMEGFVGQCHLGLTDIVEPLVFKGRVLGVFYYGSVVLRGTEDLAKKRIERYCARRKVRAAPFLKLLAKAPRIDRKTLERLRARLRLAAKISLQILEAFGLPMERYRTEFDAWFTSQRRFAPLAQAAIRYVHLNYRNPIRLAEVAAHAKCHPDYLCKVLRREFRCGLGDYVNRVRVDHARRLISAGRFSLGEIAFQTGFSDQSYFNKIFKSLIGCTPGEYKESGGGSRAPQDLEAFHYSGRRGKAR